MSSIAGYKNQNVIWAAGQDRFPFEFYNKALSEFLNKLSLLYGAGCSPLSFNESVIFPSYIKGDSQLLLTGVYLSSIVIFLLVCCSKDYAIGSKITKSWLNLP